MQCPSCGAVYKRRFLKCPKCGAIRNEDFVEPTEPQSTFTPTTEATGGPQPRQKRRARATSSLLEFPDVNKSSMPQWRKELGERVRKVQERKARKVALEAGEAGIASGVAGSKAQPLLELLPQTEEPAMNPLVVAALRRIERAHVASRYGSNAVAVAYQEQTDFREAGPNMVEHAYAAATPLEEEPPNDDFSAPPPERVHNVAVVAFSAVTTPETPAVTIKPKRLIVGDPNDPALNYLDYIPTTIHVDHRAYRSAPVFSRVVSAIIDLLIVCLLSTPLVAFVELTDLKWQDVRVLTLIGVTLLLVAFLYLTITTALTGGTCGMRLLSLRVVDARTGLIPTGGQSAGRAAVYMLSLASAGIALIYAFIDSENYTIHDRLTRTAVIRM